MGTNSTIIATSLPVQLGREVLSSVQATHASPQPPEDYLTALYKNQVEPNLTRQKVTERTVRKFFGDILDGSSAIDFTADTLATLCDTIANVGPTQKELLGILCAAGLDATAADAFIAQRRSEHPEIYAHMVL